jgi:ATP-binding cassette subfamily C (CFTR/MRP) protein 10
MKKKKRILAFLISAIFFFPNLLSTVVFSVFIVTGHKIDLATAFSVIVFFDLIIDPMISFPMMISSFVDFKVSMTRIQEYLSQKEINVEKLIKKEENDEYAIQIKNHSFSWGIKEKEHEEKKETKDKKANAEIEEPLIDDNIENKT